MRLYVARHGQTAWNAENKICGTTDLPLDEVGFAQAEALAEKCGAYQIDLIIDNPDTEKVINSISEFTQYIADNRIESYIVTKSI